MVAAEVQPVSLGRKMLFETNLKPPINRNLRHYCKGVARVGWLTGFEPATARSTIWSSNQAELQPPPTRRTLWGGPPTVKLCGSFHLPNPANLQAECDASGGGVPCAWHGHPGGSTRRQSGKFCQRHRRGCAVQEDTRSLWLQGRYLWPVRATFGSRVSGCKVCPSGRGWLVETLRNPSGQSPAIERRVKPGAEAGQQLRPAW